MCLACNLSAGFAKIPSSPRRPKGLWAVGSEHPESHLDNVRGWALVSQSEDSCGEMFNLGLGCNGKEQHLLLPLQEVHPLAPVEAPVLGAGGKWGTRGAQ